MTSHPRVVAFFGTPDAAVPSLDVLRARSDVRVVVTRPDKPRGRSGRLRPSAVKEAALNWNLAIAQPDRAAEIAADLAGYDLAVVVAYGQLLPEGLLAVPRCGFVNVHFSLLPRWRGAAPVARAILAGDSTTGVTLMQLDAGMDTGDIVASEAVAIGEGDTTGSLTERLAGLGATLLSDNLDAILAGTATRTAQGADATAAKKVTSAEAKLQPKESSALHLHRMVRAFNPKPGAWGLVDEQRLKIWEAQPLAEDELEAGELAVLDDLLHLGTKEGVLVLRTVQQAGGGRMSGLAWANGHRGAWRLG